MTKVCSKCKKEKPFTAFHKCKSKTNGLQSYCKECKLKWKHSIIGRKSAKKSRNILQSYLRQVFRDIIHRCTSSKYHSYHRYGGRGIKCKFKSSDEFVDYVINELQVDPRNLQIDRIDNNGHYEKGNIRFVTAKENCLNKG